MRFTYLLALAIAPLGAARGEEPRAPANPFYAMDTAFRRPGLSTDEQLDLLKQLGYAGIAWTETSPDEARQVADAAAKRGLKMFTIYCAAKVTPEGDLSYRPTLKPLMAALKDHGTIIWLHIGGKGPAFETLTGKELAVAKLRELADEADRLGLKIAVYPHVGEWTERVQYAVRLAKVVDRKNFGVTFNLCHCLALGDEARIPELLKEAAPHLITVTVNGADAGLKGPDWKRLIQPLGQGTYDVRIVLRTLREIGFTGPVGFQGYGIQADTRSIVEPTMQAWKRLSANLNAP